MSFEVLQKQIQALPEAALNELFHYVEYLSFVYSNKKETNAVTSKIDDFLKKNPDAFEEFRENEKASIKSIRELTKNDTW